MRSSNNITAVIIFFILKATQILRKLNLYKISSFHKGLNIAAVLAFFFSSPMQAFCQFTFKAFLVAFLKICWKRI